MAAPQSPAQGDLLADSLLLLCNKCNGDLRLLPCDQGLRLTLIYGDLHGWQPLRHAQACHSESSASVKIYAKGRPIHYNLIQWRTLCQG